MSLQCNEFEYCKVNVQYIADTDIVKDKRESVLNKFKKANIKIPGFRKGKATTLAIKKHLKKQIDAQVLQELVSHAYEDIIFETKMKPIGYPQIVQHDLYGDRFSCELVFLKKPQFELTGYRDFEIPTPHMETSIEAETEKMLQQVRVANADVVPYGENEFVQDHDQVTIDIDCVIDSEKVEALSTQGYFYEVGTKLITEFDENIMGMSPGDVRTFTIKFGDDVGEYSNKDAEFTVKLHMGTKKILPALDDEFAKKLGHDSFDKLREVALGAAAKKFNALLQQQLQKQISNRLLENNKFEVPEWLVSQEVQIRMANVDMSQLTDDLKKQIVDSCEDSVRLALIMDEIREQEPEAFISNEEIIRSLRAQIEAAGQDPNLILKQKERDGSLHGLVASLLNEFTMQWILSTSKVID